MGTFTGSSPSRVQGESSSLATSPRLLGISQKVGILLWGLVTITSLVSLTLSIYSLNLWDRIPAAETPRYFPDMTAEDVQLHTDWQNTVLERGLTLSGYALTF